MGSIKLKLWQQWVYVLTFAATIITAIFFALTISTVNWRQNLILVTSFAGIAFLMIFIPVIILIIRNLSHILSNWKDLLLVIFTFIFLGGVLIWFSSSFVRDLAMGPVTYNGPYELDFNSNFRNYGGIYYQVKIEGTSLNLSKADAIGLCGKSDINFVNYNFDYCINRGNVTVVYLKNLNILLDLSWN